MRTTAMLDRGIDPLSAYDAEENAMRVAIGHMGFGTDLDAQGSHLDRLYFIPEIAPEAFQDLTRVMSLNIQSMSQNDFGTVYETANCDHSFALLKWSEGVEKLQDEVLSHPELAEKSEVHAILAINSIDIDSIDTDVAARLIGSPSGFRFESTL